MVFARFSEIQQKWMKFSGKNVRMDGFFEIQEKWMVSGRNFYDTVPHFHIALALFLEPGANLLFAQIGYFFQNLGGVVLRM